MKLFRFSLTALIALQILLISGCEPKKSELIGVYTRSRGAEIETIELKSDGTFRQTVKYPDGRMWAINDSWKLNGTVVQLSRRYEVYDFEHKTVIDPPKIGYESTFNDEGNQLFENEIDVFPYKRVFSQTSK